MPGASPLPHQGGVKSGPGGVQGMRTSSSGGAGYPLGRVQQATVLGSEKVGEPDVVVEWFPEAATCAAGNQVSFATGTSEEHEALGLTAIGSWVVRRWRDGVAGETSRPVTPGEAREWLLRCELFEVVEEHFPSGAPRLHPLRLSRLYEPRTPEDGHRVLVDRLWPRGISRAGGRMDSWLPEVAPSAELRAWYGHRPELFAEFSRRYQAELSSTKWAGPLARVEDLRRAGPLALVTATRDLEHSGARVLYSWLGGAESQATAGPAAGCSAAANLREVSPPQAAVARCGHHGR